MGPRRTEVVILSVGKRISETVNGAGKPQKNCRLALKATYGHWLGSVDPLSRHSLVESSSTLIGYFPVKQALQKCLAGKGIARNIPSKLRYARESAPMKSHICSTVLEQAINSPLLEKSMP
jgi:hypothetical protein